MPRHKVGDLTTPGRYAQLNWRRDEQEPGYVQLSTHGPDTQDPEFVHLDEAGCDEMIRTLHRAKRQVFGGECGQVPCDHAPDGGNHPQAAVNVHLGSGVSVEQVARAVNAADLLDPGRNA